MKSPNRRNETEDLAERLRSLYQTYNCEEELPAHDDLVAKLDNVKPEVREGIKMELDQDYASPISHEKVLEFVDEVCAEELMTECNENASRYFKWFKMSIRYCFHQHPYDFKKSSSKLIWRE